MAKMEVFDTPCADAECDARATWTVKTDAGAEVGRYCTRHAQTKCREIAKRESAKGTGR